MTYSPQQIADRIRSVLQVEVPEEALSLPQKTSVERYQEKLERNRRYQKKEYKSVTRRVSLSLSLNEYERLLNQSRKKGVKPTTLARTFVLESLGQSVSHLPVEVAEELRNLQRDLVGVVTNINQMAYRVNIQGVSQFNEGVLIRQVQILDAQIQKTLEELYQKKEES